MRNAAAALDFYVDAFGAVEHHRLVGDDGRIGHAEIVIGTSRIMLADEYPEIDSVSPTTRGGLDESFTVEVPDVDAVVRTCGRSGRDIERAGRRPVLRPPQGIGARSVRPSVGAQHTDRRLRRRHRATPAAGSRARRATNSIEHGHQVKQHDTRRPVLLHAAGADLAKAQAFFGAVLGWQFPTDADTRAHVGNISAPRAAGSGRAGRSTRAQLWFVVDDIHAAVARSASSAAPPRTPVLYDSGWAADCVDDQGTTFNLSVPAAKYRV